MTNNTTNTSKKLYKHLTKEDRIKIELLHHQGWNKTKIADFIGVHKSTISRELRKRIKFKVMIRTGKSYVLPYTADAAQEDYRYKRSFSKCKYLLEKYPKLKTYIENKIIIDGWMPDAITNHIIKKKLYLEDGMTIVSTPTIYNAIRNNVLNVKIENMRRMKEKEKIKYTTRKGLPVNKREHNIELRPEKANLRLELGHWEADTVVSRRNGQNECLLVLTERMTRYQKIIRLKLKTKEQMNKALKKVIKEYDFAFKSVTSDNGSEFAGFKDIIHKTGINYYFCHPYSSFERGTNEKNNSIIRYFIKKGEKIENYTNEQIQEIEEWMNNYPRKILNWETPSSAFKKALSF